MAAAVGAGTMPGVAPELMVAARLDLTDRAWCGVSQLDAPPRGTAGAASEDRRVLLRPLWESERSDASELVPEPTTTTGDQ
eukprot:14904844-Alexandrium_andersonii.AAC.1